MDQGSREDQIERHDPAIFAVESSTSEADRVSLLAIQALVRRRKAAYAYLEIGSYRGGTLLPHLADPRCRSVVSIDKRPDLSADERARFFVYKGFTTERMVADLRQHLAPDEIGKLTTFDADASDLTPDEIGRDVDLVLIDGEHTVTATFSDGMGVIDALAPDGLLVFHDCNLILDAIRNLQRVLRHRGLPHRLFLLPDVVGVIALGDAIAAAEAALRGRAHDETRFDAEARRLLQEQIAASVTAGLHQEDFGLRHPRDTEKPGLGARLAARLRRSGA